MIGPLLFLTYISDITDDVASLPLIYADDATPFEIVNEPAGRLNSDLNKISEWADKWLVTMNPVNSRNVVFSRKRKVVKDVESHTHLGLTLQSNMWWRNHIAKM